MAPYLIENPPVRSQWSARAVEETGSVGVHTAESLMDDVGPDTGAENVASFIRGRGDPGCYSCIADSDSVILMVPDEFAAFHVAASDAWGVNMRHFSWSLCFATSAHLWGTNPDWDQAAIENGGWAIANYLKRLATRKAGFKPTMALRWLPHESARRRESGLWQHGVAQPSDRSDWCKFHPLRISLETRLVAEISANLEEDDMFEDKDRKLLQAIDARLKAIEPEKPEDWRKIPGSVPDGKKGSLHRMVRSVKRRQEGKDGGIVLPDVDLDVDVSDEDIASIAEGVRDQLGDDVAQRVVDELTARLSD